jgi:hypothetical protein
MAYELLKCGLPIDIVRVINEYLKGDTHLVCSKCKRTVLYLQSHLIFPLNKATQYECIHNTLSTKHGYTIRQRRTLQNAQIVPSSGILTVTDPNTFISIDSNIYSVWSQKYVMEEDYYVKNSNVICLPCDMMTQKVKLRWSQWKTNT